MKRMVYRGISLTEAQSVISGQRYKRNEPREFNDGVQAKSIFGSGIYLISDAELAAQYAFCHAEVEAEELAVVLKQRILLENPFILNRRFTEERLRNNAFSWKFSEKEIPNVDLTDESLEMTKWIGNIIREYLLYHGYDGIIYHINDEIIYYVSYFQDKQIEDIDYDFIFKIKELKDSSVPLLREGYKNDPYLYALGENA